MGHYSPEQGPYSPSINNTEPLGYYPTGYPFKLPSNFSGLNFSDLNGSFAYHQGLDGKILLFPVSLNHCCLMQKDLVCMIVTVFE